MYEYGGHSAFHLDICSSDCWAVAIGHHNQNKNLSINVDYQSHTNCGTAPEQNDTQNASYLRIGYVIDIYAGRGRSSPRSSLAART